MILQELFDKTRDLGRVVSMSEEFHAFKKIGGREIRFTASLIKNGHWEIEFAELGEDDGSERPKTMHAMTGKGHEFKVMQFVMSALSTFLAKYDPRRIEFSSYVVEESRVSLYRRMLKRFAEGYIVREFELGMDREHKMLQFELIKKPVSEGLIMEEKILKTEDGELWYTWRKDLEDEEFEGYIPDGYSKRVLELSLLKVNEPGKGHGDELMKAFLETPEAKKAELIFLDPNPGIGVNFKSSMSEAQQVAKLVKFYKRYGFRHNPKSATKRMWLVRKGSIPEHELPT